MERRSLPEKSQLLGASAAHRQVIETLDRVAPTDAEVLITGPTGVGKELYANYLHLCSPRADRAFVAVNCGGLPQELRERIVRPYRRRVYGSSATEFRSDRRG